MSAEVRDALVKEAPAICALLEEHALAAFGEPELSEDEIRSWFSNPKVWIQVAEREGRLAGYLDVAAEEGGRFNVDVRTLETGPRRPSSPPRRSGLGRRAERGRLPAATSRAMSRYCATFTRARAGGRSGTRSRCESS